MIWKAREYNKHIHKLNLEAFLEKIAEKAKLLSQENNSFLF